MSKFLPKLRNALSSYRSSHQSSYFKHQSVRKDSSHSKISSQNITDSAILNAYLELGHLNHYSVLPNEFKSLILKHLENKNGFDTSILSTCSTIEEKSNLLQKLFCNGLSLEFETVNSDERIWFCNQFINRHSRYEYTNEDKIKFLTMMKKGEYFDQFLATKFQSVKRYSGEGAESMLVFIDELFKTASVDNIDDIVIAMAHRGRNNLLTVLLNYPPEVYFRKMKGKSEFPNDINIGTGDTFSHFYQSTDLTYGDKKVHISLIPNPSHLESNIPVGAGKVRSKMWTKREGSYSETGSGPISTMALFVHGDASVSGQGIVTESLVMTNSDQFEIGGGVHLVINNRVGFTTPTPAHGQNHVTDLAKLIQSPVLHVDAFNVLEVANAARLAIEYRQQYNKDVFVNLICYRKWGHNELDDPTITQPQMYARINQLSSIPACFQQEIESHIGMDTVQEELGAWRARLTECLTSADTYEPSLQGFREQWRGMKLVTDKMRGLAVYDTGYDLDHLRQIGAQSVTYPDEFSVHPNVLKAHIRRRIERLQEDPDSSASSLDWSTGEALAVGSVLHGGMRVRLSGQDVGRGTFNHRHFVLTDQHHHKQHTTLGVEVANSVLSEEAVLAFELGLALDHPDILCIWEAQFGDFCNGAQVILDTYLGSTETKWLLQNGLVLLLPHGYDGAGPEHSSCRLERFLQLSDSSETSPDSDTVNIGVVNPTTPGQYFHVLRRQVVRPFRKPLIVVAPKLLLRSPLATSSLSDLRPGSHFHHVIPPSHHLNNGNKCDAVTHVLLCSGKHYYALEQHLNSPSITETQRPHFALIRIEQLSPFPVVDLYHALSRYRNAAVFRWCQEEPRNMGAWQFVGPRIRNMLGIELQYAGRKELAAPAVGIGELYKQEVQDIMRDAFVK